MIVAKNVHTHKFTNPATQVVKLWHEEIDQETGERKKGATDTAIDTLKLLVCECGKSMAVDLTRVKT